MARKGTDRMNTKTRNVLFTLGGAAALAAKGRYGGPFQDFVRSYGGNFVVSFAMYFLLANLPFPRKWSTAAAAGGALAAVSLFEATNGFGVMANTYDPWDFVANGAGIALAACVDAALPRAVESKGR